MDLTNCDTCGIVMNRDIINFPPIYDDQDDTIDGNSVWGRDKGFIAIIPCPISSCSGFIREEDE